MSWPIDWWFDKWNICLTVHIHWKVLMQFYMHKSHSLSTPMIMRSLDINDDSVWSQKKDEEFLGDKTLYLGAIRALVHLTNNIWPDICFAVNLLPRFCFSPIKGHWNGVEHMIEYPRKTIVMSLFYSEESKTKLIGYADAEYLYDPHKTLSQARYVFACGGTIISWRSMKQMLWRDKSPTWSKLKVRLR